MMGVRLRARQVLCVGFAVEGAAAGGEDDPLTLGLSCALEDVERAHHVDGGVEGGALHRDPHVGLCGQVEHQLGAAARHQLDHRGHRYVQMVDGERPAGAAFAVSQVGQRPRREVVDDVDFVALDKQAIHEVGPDEARTSRHERWHGAPVLARDTLAVDHRSGGHHRVGAENRHRPDVSPLADNGTGAHDGTGHLGFAATWQPSMRTESVTTAPDVITVPGPRMLRATCAPGSTRQPAKTTEGPTTWPSRSLSPSVSTWPSRRVSPGATSGPRRPFT